MSWHGGLLYGKDLTVLKKKKKKWIVKGHAVHQITIKTH